MGLSIENVHSIAIFRALQLGDLLCAVPAIRTLRKAYPTAKISFIGLSAMSEVIARFPDYIDDFIPFPGYPGLPEQQFDAEKFNSFKKKMKANNFDLILQMQGNGSIVNTMLGSLGAKHLSGFCESKEEENDLFLQYPNVGHEIQRHLALMRHLGIGSTYNDTYETSAHTDLEFPLSLKDTETLSLPELRVAPKKYVCLHPGSRSAWRQWPPCYFASLADHCMEKGYEVVITGTNSELRLAHTIASLMKRRPIISSGKTSLGGVAILIKNAFALISNCTGVSHIAAALKTPSVVISMDGEPDRWGPLNKTLHRTVDWTKKPAYDEVLKELLSLFSTLSKPNTACNI